MNKNMNRAWKNTTIIASTASSLLEENNIPCYEDKALVQEPRLQVTSSSLFIRSKPYTVYVLVTSGFDYH